MTSLLVSFPNVFPQGLALAVYDFDNCNLRWVDLAGAGEQMTGVTGLSKYPSGYLCLAQMPSRYGASALLMMDHDLNLREVHQLKETGDAHSLLSIDGGFLANDTLKNRLIRIELSNDGQPPREFEYWRRCDEPTDVFHVNSTARLNGEVFISMFDRKPEAGWENSRDGKIVNISRNCIICSDLAHPHSLVNVDGVLYWLESYRGLIHRFSAASGHEVVGKLEGYLRGLTYDEQYLYVGGSALRRRPKGGGTLNKLAPLTPETANSWIYRLDRRSLEVERRKLTAFSFEIYDLLLLEEFKTASSGEESDPFVQRVWRFEDAYLEAVSGLEWSLSATREGAEHQALQFRNTVESQARHVEALETKIENLSGELEVHRAELARRDDEIRLLQQHQASLRMLETDLALKDAYIREYALNREQHIANLQAALDRILYSPPGRVYRWIRNFVTSERRQARGEPG